MPGTITDVRFAYADPPYPGQSKRLYGSHPDYAGEVDHADLIGRLCRDYPDGWVLSTNAESLQSVLALCPPVRVAIWNVTSRAPVKGGALGRWHPSWEPVLIHGGRKDWGEGPLVRDLLSSGTHRQGRFPGGKPPVFCRWVFNLLGARPGDSLDDLYPGSGAIGKAWAQFASQPALITFDRALESHNAVIEHRRWARLMDPLDASTQDYDEMKYRAERSHAQDARSVSGVTVHPAQRAESTATCDMRHS